MLHIAHAGVYTAGAYLGLYLFHQTGSFVLALAGSMLITGLIGAFIERVIYRPMIPKPRIVALIASIGIFICLSALFRILGGPYQLPFDYPALAGGIKFFCMSPPVFHFVFIAGTTFTFYSLCLFAT